MTLTGAETYPARGASLIALLAGVWLFLSPWIFGASGNASAWNSWIIGAAIFVLGIFRRSHVTDTGLSWFISILGIWIVASPWVYGYAGNAARLMDSLCTGFVIFCAALVAANSQRMSHDTASTSM